jgi:hypothetical protein
MTPPKQHPSPELLADYVSDTLSAAERASLQTHLQSCERCTLEVAEASVGRAALARLPEAEPPPGIADRALAEAAGETPDQPSGPGWYRWGGIAAAAAAFALILTLVRPKIGGGGAADRAATANLGGASSTPVLIEISSANYHGAALTKLAGEHPSGSAPEANVSTPSAVSGTATQTAAGSACVRRAFRKVDGTLVRLIQAKFEGQKAYLALYAESPGAGQPADAVTVRVAGVSGCAPLSIAQAPLPSVAH